MTKQEKADKPVSPVQQPHDREPDPGHRREIRLVDATPDEGFPIRILQAYKETGMFTDNTMGMPPESEIAVKMNEWQEQRNSLLDVAIKKLAQLPQPFAPVQSGCVDLIGIKDAYKDGWNDAIENLHDDEAEEWAWDRVRSYLAHLTTTQSPVQSGGVDLSGEIRAIIKHLDEGIATENWDEAREASNHLDVLVKNHLTTTQSPVQSGCVELHDFYLWRRALGFDDRETMAEDYSTDEIDVVEKIRELLTTTQIAPSVGSVPTVEELQEIIEPIIANRVQHVSAQDVECPVCFSALESAQAIHALLTSRTELERLVPEATREGPQGEIMTRRDDPLTCQECGDPVSSFGIYAQRGSYLIICTNPQHDIRLPNCDVSELPELFAKYLKEKP